MPLYEYQCQACGERFELIRKFSDPPLEQCRKCGSGPVERLVSSPAFQFKGSGWYVTDYAQKDKKGGTGPTKSESKSDDSAPAPTTGASEGASTPASPSSAKESSPATKASSSTTKE